MEVSLFHCNKYFGSGAGAENISLVVWMTSYFVQIELKATIVLFTLISTT